MTSQKQHDETEISTRPAWRKLIPLFAPHKYGTGICVALLVVVAGLTISKGLLIRQAIDDNMAGKDLSGLLLTVGLYLAAQATLLVVTYVQRVKLEKIGQRIIADLKERLFEKILGLSLSFFDRNSAGRLMARVESDTDSLRMLFTFAITVIIGDLILIVALVTTMAIVSPRLTLIICAAVPVTLALTYVYDKLTSKRFLKSRKVMADITSRITEFLQGIAVIQIFNRTAYARSKVREVNREKFMLDRFVHISSTTYFNIVYFMEALLIAGVVFWGGKQVAAGVLTIGVIIMFVQYLRKMFDPIYRFADELYVVQKALSGIKRIFSLLAHDESIREPMRPFGISSIEEGIRFENVWFSYNNNDDYALKDVSFELRRGERVALVGVTGGGKSSIINLLLRFYDPQRGRITIDGANIKDMTKDELRRLYGLVLQDIYLFPGTVSSNVSLGSSSISTERVRSAIHTVGAGEFIESLPGGLDARISEQGSNLSRGERQLLSFARALAFDPQVLILDEATSSVDPETERRIQLALSRLLKNRTSLIVAHRLSTILECDRIIVVKDGQIHEEGTHQQLVEVGKYYYNLFRLQFAGARDGQASTAEGITDESEREVSHVES